MNTPRQIYSHTALRGIAALFVVMYHLQFGSHYWFPLERSTDIFLKSYVWVDFFFLLSGFILCHVYYRERRIPFSKEEATSFLIARIARVYPLHILTFFGLIAFHFAALSYFDLSGSPPHEVVTQSGELKQIIAHLFLVQSWGVVEQVGWNIPSWSISTEFAAYLAFPLIVWALVKARMATLVMMGLLATGFYVWVAATTRDLDIVVGLSVARCFAGFFLGIILYTLRDCTKSVSDRVLTIAQVASLLGIFTLLEHSDNDPLLIVPFFVLVLSVSEDRGAIPRFLRHRAFQALGEWSYGIYMLHVPVILVGSFFFARMMESFGGRYLNDPLERLLWFLLVFAATLVLSRYLHHHFEKPMRKLIVTSFNGSKRVSPTVNAKTINTGVVKSNAQPD